MFIVIKCISTDISVLQSWKTISNNSFSASDILFHGNTYFLSNCTRRSYMHVFALVIFPYKANFVSSCPSQKRWQPFRTKAYCIKIWLFKALTNFMALLQWYFLVIVIIEPKILRYLMTCNTLMPGYISFCVYDLFHNILFLF